MADKIVVLQPGQQLPPGESIGSVDGGILMSIDDALFKGEEYVGPVLKGESGSEEKNIADSYILRNASTEGLLKLKEIELKNEMLERMSTGCDVSLGFKIKCDPEHQTTYTGLFVLAQLLEKKSPGAKTTLWDYNGNPQPLTLPGLEQALFEMGAHIQGLYAQFRQDLADYKADITETDKQ